MPTSAPEAAAWPTWPGSGDPWCVARAGNLAVQHRQLVAQDGDLDVLGVWCGTEANQPENASYEEEDEGRGNAGHPPRWPSRLLRTAILCLHPSRRRDQAIGGCIARTGNLAL